ncbi:MAG: GGDEF domain-containing protein [Chitinivibrionales bacterium]|nr:GGDEF domain-containing protein [Chitinivibrionales bacterium]
MNEALPLFDEREKDESEYPIADSVLTLDVVSAFAGDRPITEAEKNFLDDLHKKRGGRFYTDLLYAVTHHLFSPTIAENLWNNILRHKYEMSTTMNRNIRIAVASLDYLSNLTGELHAATVIDEAHIAAIVNLSVHDNLTGLFNHAFCYQKVDQELKRHARYGTPVSLMMIDTDNFKELNDHFGHPEGDTVLAEIGKLLKEGARELDICCRYGGDEFAVILPQTDAHDAGILAERLRAKIEECKPKGHAMTFSIGVASCAETVCTSQNLVQKADTALYEAKRAGKNRVVVRP